MRPSRIFWITRPSPDGTLLDQCPPKFASTRNGAGVSEMGSALYCTACRSTPVGESAFGVSVTSAAQGSPSSFPQFATPCSMTLGEKPADQASPTTYDVLGENGAIAKPSVPSSPAWSPATLMSAPKKKFGGSSTSVATRSTRLTIGSGSTPTMVTVANETSSPAGNPKKSRYAWPTE